MEIALLSASDQVIDTSRNGESDGYLRLDHVYAEGDYVQVEFERQLLPGFFWVQVALFYPVNMALCHSN